MPLDHNIKTAYLLVPSNVTHGDELKCSYPACAEAGVKFCYCAYCRSPVARRNFRVRHHHAFQVPGQPGPQAQVKEEILETEAPMESADASPAADDEAQQQPEMPPASLLSQLQSLAAASGQQQALPRQAQNQDNEITAILLQQLLSNSMNNNLGHTNGSSVPASDGMNAARGSKKKRKKSNNPKPPPALEPNEPMGEEEDDHVGIGTLAFQMKIPCPARGMPPGHHRLEDAHFVIPKNAEHGDDLICSFPACRDAGVKVLHHHKFARTAPKAASSSSSAKNSGAKNSASFGSSSSNPAPDLSSLVCQEIDETQKTHEQKDVAATLFGMKRKRDDSDETDRRSMAVTSYAAAADRSSSASTSEKDNSANEGEDSSDFENNTRDMSEYPDRERTWLELLAERPEDTEGKSMVEWLEKVVAASEPSSEEVG
ncbi:MAG: hypothetical protein SGILL_002265, partial [Bacillariaceae sp.]